MRFVVTGGVGFVGSHLVKLLVKNGHEITVIDNLHTGKKENLDEVKDKIEFLNIDIQDYDSMEKNMKAIDGVFHQAALTIVQDSFKMPEKYHSVNVNGTESIFKIAQKNNEEDLFEKLSILINDQGKARKMGERGKEFVIKNFNWDKICNDFLNHLKKHNIREL